MADAAPKENGTAGPAVPSTPKPAIADQKKLAEQRELAETAKTHAALSEYLANRYPTDGLWRMLRGPLAYRAGQATAPPDHRPFREFFVEHSYAKTTPAGQIEKVDVYPDRHLSFDSGPALAQFLKKKKSTRLDVGALNTIRPRAEKLYPEGCSTVAFKELTFDVDIDEYDKAPGRSCCGGRAICRACWPLVTIGCVITDTLLRAAFGVEKIGWFFSGGRGMHCWVLSPSFLCSPVEQVRTTALETVAPENPASVFIPRAVLAADPAAIDMICALVPAVAARAKRATIPEIFPSAAPLESDAPCACMRSGRRCPIHGYGKSGAFLGWYADVHPASAINALRSAILAARYRVRDEKDEENARCASESKGSGRNRATPAPVAADDAESLRTLETWRDRLCRHSEDARTTFAALKRLRKEAGGCARTTELGMESALEIVRVRAEENDKTALSERDAFLRLTELFADLAVATESGAAEFFSPRVDPRSGRTFVRNTISRAVVEAAIASLSPRMDRAVTRQPGHLLKAPMSVHPVTLRLAVRVPTANLLDFLPTDSPTLSRDISKGVQFDDEQAATRAISDFNAWTETL